MNKTFLTNFFNDARLVLEKHSPEILTGIGIAGMVTTTILAVKATPLAVDLIKSDSRLAHNGDPYAYTKTEAIKSCWKCYIPAAVTCTVSIACLIGASSVNAKRNTALLTAYKLSETALTEYKEKVVETIGEKKEKSVRDAIAKDYVEKNPVQKNDVIITGKGDTLCCDKMFGRYFKSDIDKLKKIENELNRRMRDEMYISLNEFYYEVGLDGVEAGDDIGWNIERGYIDLQFSSQLTSDGTPCLVVSFLNPPKYDYK